MKNISLSEQQILSGQKLRKRQVVGGASGARACCFPTLRPYGIPAQHHQLTRNKIAAAACLHLLGGCVGYQALITTDAGLARSVPRVASQEF